MEHHTQNKLLPDNIFLSYIQCEKYLRSASASTFFHTWNEQSVFKDYSEKYFWEKSTRYPKMWWLEKYFSVSYNSKGIQDQNIPLSLSRQKLRMFCLNSENMSSPYISLTVLGIFQILCYFIFLLIISSEEKCDILFLLLNVHTMY